MLWMHAGAARMPNTKPSYFISFSGFSAFFEFVIISYRKIHQGPNREAFVSTAASSYTEQLCTLEEGERQRPLQSLDSPQKYVAPN